MKVKTFLDLNNYCSFRSRPGGRVRGRASMGVTGLWELLSVTGRCGHRRSRARRARAAAGPPPCLATCCLAVWRADGRPAPGIAGRARPSRAEGAAPALGGCAAPSHCNPGYKTNRSPFCLRAGKWRWRRWATRRSPSMHLSGYTT